MTGNTRTSHIHVELQVEISCQKELFAPSRYYFFIFKIEKKKNVNNNKL